MRKTISLSIAFFVVIVSTGVPPALAEDIAFVKKGAFIITFETNFKIGNRKTRVPISYLPVGTVIWLKQCDITIEKNVPQPGPDDTRPGPDDKCSGEKKETIADKKYCKFDSELGVTGLIRQDRFHTLSDKPVVVAIGKGEADEKGNIDVYNNADFDRFQPKLTESKSLFSRSSCPYLDVTETDPDDNGQIDIVEISRPYVEGPYGKKGYIDVNQPGIVRYINPQKLRWNKAHVKREPVLSQIESVKSKLPEEYFEAIKEYTEKYKIDLEIERAKNNFLCDFEVSIFLEAGLFTPFISFGGNAQYNPFAADTIFDSKTSFITIEDSQTEMEIESIRTYSCTKTFLKREKEQMIEYFMSLKEVGTNAPVDIKFSDLKSPKPPKIPKMFTIDGWPVYNRKFKDICDDIIYRYDDITCENDDTENSELNTQAFHVYTQYVLDNIAYYPPLKQR